MKKRDLDGILFRVQRDGKWTNRCWTDLTDEERNQFGAGKPASWWKAVALHLTEQLRYIGDQFDLCADKDDAGENE